jgi:hypothetical protein
METLLMATTFLFWKDQTARLYKLKHRMLLEQILAVEEYVGHTEKVNFNAAVPINNIANSGGNIDENLKAIRYLLAAKYFEYAENNNEQHVRITQLGLDAINSEYFLEKGKEYIRERNNNRWMIALNIVVAIGVVYSIYKDQFIKSPSSKDKQQIIIRRETKTLDSLGTPTDPSHPISRDTGTPKPN